MRVKGKYLYLLIRLEETRGTIVSLFQSYSAPMVMLISSDTITV